MFADHAALWYYSVKSGVNFQNFDVLDFYEVRYAYRISANSCRDNYSFLRLRVRQVFKGGYNSKKETIVFLVF